MENLKVGLQITLVGVAVVFVTFSLLVLLMHWTRQALSGTGFTLRRKQALPGPVRPDLVHATGEEKSAVEVELDATTASGQTDGGIPLAMAAAISAVLSVVMSGTPYQVLAVRRVEGEGGRPGKAWSLAGRMDIMRSREVSLRRKG